MENLNSAATTTNLAVLFIFIMVLALSVLNLFFIVYGLRIRSQVLQLRNTVRNMISVAVVDLRKFENLRMHLDIQVSNVVPVKAEIPIKRTIDVDVHGVIPVKETLASDASVSTPIFGARVPLAISLPVEMMIPLNLRVPVVLDYSIPVDITVPVELTVPVDIDLRQTEIGGFIDQALATLVTLESLFAGETMARGNGNTALV